jgi:Sortilin, neurotensin receptor 3,
MSLPYVHAQWQSLINTEGVILDEKREFLRGKDSIVLFKSDNFLYISTDFGDNWNRRNLPFKTPQYTLTNNFNNYFDMRVTNKGIYVFYKEAIFNGPSSNNIYFSNDRGQNWQHFQDTSKSGHWYLQTSSDDRELYYFSGSADGGQYTLLKCTIGQNNWVKEERFPSDISGFKATNDRFVYTKRDSIILIERPSLRKIKGVKTNSRSPIINFSDSLVTIENIYDSKISLQYQRAVVVFDLKSLNTVCYNCIYGYYAYEGTDNGTTLNWGNQIIGYKDSTILGEDKKTTLNYDGRKQGFIKYIAVADSTLYAHTAGSNNDNLYRYKKSVILQLFHIAYLFSNPNTICLK